ncbi:hypothetical protein VNO80_29033 [Phaseolus coccineus]|uniref:Uncharacterized protein n=1 Tax=Phaseolus coccineus TaxID=3886 RepID=A0AAN9QI44_PHACN
MWYNASLAFVSYFSCVQDTLVGGTRQRLDDGKAFYDRKRVLNHKHCSAACAKHSFEKPHRSLLIRFHRHRIFLLLPSVAAHRRRRGILNVDDIVK